MATTRNQKNASTARKANGRSRAARKTTTAAADADADSTNFDDNPDASASKATRRPGDRTMNRTLLIDLSQRELQERARLKTRRDRLEAVKRTEDSSGGLSAEQEAELERIKAALDSDLPVDPFYQAVAAALRRRTWNQLAGSRDHVLEHGLFGSQQMDPVQGGLGNHEQEIAFVCGLLEVDNFTVPTAPGFIKKVSEAQGEFRQNEALFDIAYETFRRSFVVTVQSQIDSGMVDADIIGCISPGGPINQDPDDDSKPYRRDTKGQLRDLDEGEAWIPAATDKVNVLSARNIAAVVRKLAGDGVTADDAWIRSRLESTYNQQTGVTSGGSPSAVEIMLPDLEEAVDIEIVTENLHAVQAIYFTYQLEEMRLFQVVERVVDLFRQGLLPLGKGFVGDYLFNYYKKAAERITEGERRDLYMRAFGAPGGNPSSEPNRDFNELWLRFVSAVSSFARQLTVERMLRNAVPMAVSQEQVRKAGRDLGANLSRNGYGIAYFAATEMQQTILEFRDVLQNAELRNAFGARDMWQVIDQVNVNYLGGARNTHRYRTQSRAGAVVIRWIANNVQRLANVGGPVIYVEQIINPQLRAAGGSSNPTVDPTDWDLVNACEQWLAVGGVQDQSIEQYSQPIEAPTMTSRPIEIPQVARDMLSGLGVGLNGSGVAGGISMPGL
ncbi:hypothetical protein [Piscinibacter terrae]|uniref:Uncharacterized protein n=1 Tax=Piscinibacter terrae TaxID=2496871 RepID=A0A3N7HLN1_9BURK|nr:hypothetical protein [Albitalea terrae]RQP23038.1 hypothetical protein DZC73_18090 [Albitalea terrae]